MVTLHCYFGCTTGVFNTEPKDSEVNKKTEIIVKDTFKKSAEEKAQAEAEAKAAAEAQAQIS